MNISDNKVVSFHYTLKNDDGEIIDSSSGHDPLAYIHGQGNIIPGLENALGNKAVGDKLAVVVPPEEGYGLRDADLMQAVALANFQDPSQVAVGVQFQAQVGDHVHIATVTKVDGDVVTIDMNHPLADMVLHFDVEVMGVRDATSEELEHGHVHHDGHTH